MITLIYISLQNLQVINGGPLVRNLALLSMSWTPLFVNLARMKMWIIAMLRKMVGLGTNQPSHPFNVCYQLFVVGKERQAYDLEAKYKN